MKIKKLPNGLEIVFKNKFFVLRLSKTFKLFKEKGKMFLFQINRFENGYINIYLRLFRKYHLFIMSIKSKQNKPFFFGNKEY